MPVPGVSQVPLSPLKPSVTAYMARSRSLRNSNLQSYGPHKVQQVSQVAAAAQ
jgi:hypothetical protein